MRYSEKFLVIVFVSIARLEEFIIPNSFPTSQLGINFLSTGVEHAHMQSYHADGRRAVTQSLGRMPQLERVTKWSGTFYLDW